MTLHKQILLTSYYQATRPLRWWLRRRAAAARRAPLAVVFFHRIADDRANDWTSSNAMFRRQITWLARHFEMVSLAETQRRLRAGVNDRPTVSVTFDDGYADNLQAAIPLLLAAGIPCTYFVTVQNVLSGEPFAHDLAHGRALTPNSIRQLRQMAADGIEIGCHCETHADLGAVHDPDRLYAEVVASRQRLQDALQGPIRYFAFPYGLHRNLNREAFRLARAAGYEGVCSAYGAFNYPGDDPFHIQRIGVDDDLIGLKNWLTGDPRKLRRPRFDDGTAAAPAAS